MAAHHCSAAAQLHGNRGFPAHQPDGRLSVGRGLRVAGLVVPERWLLPARMVDSQPASRERRPSDTACKSLIMNSGAGRFSTSVDPPPPGPLVSSSERTARRGACLERSDRDELRSGVHPVVHLGRHRTDEWQRAEGSRRMTTAAQMPAALWTQLTNGGANPGVSPVGGGLMGRGCL